MYYHPNLTVIICLSLSVECPVGTYETDGKCELCPEGQYQGVEGQAQCHPCPEGLSAPEGSVFESDCKFS